MSASFLEAIWVACGLVIANFIYQYVQDVPQVMVAAERSFFQLLAIAAVYLALKGNEK